MWAKHRLGRELAAAISITHNFSCSYLPKRSILLTTALADKSSSYLLVNSPLERQYYWSHHKRLTPAAEAPFLPYTDIKSSHWQWMNERQETAATEITSSIICLTRVNSWGLSDSALALPMFKIHSVFSQRKYVEYFENLLMVSSSAVELQGGKERRGRREKRVWVLPVYGHSTDTQTLEQFQKVRNLLEADLT